MELLVQPAMEKYLLKQLDKEKHGAPYTDDNDVPEYLRSHMAQPKENEWDTDSLHFMRWDWIIAEMIWFVNWKTMTALNTKIRISSNDRRSS